MKKKIPLVVNWMNHRKHYNNRSAVDDINWRLDTDYPPHRISEWRLGSRSMPKGPAELMRRDLLGDDKFNLIKLG